MGFGIAIKAFCAALFDKQKAEQIERVLAGQPVSAGAISGPEAERSRPQTQPPVPQSPLRDPAVTLLATLQREARLVDLIQEDLSQYSDAQVGAAARPCLQQCGGVLNRLFELQPLVVATEGETVDVGGKCLADALPMDRRRDRRVRKIDSSRLAGNEGRAAEMGGRGG